MDMMISLRGQRMSPAVVARSGAERPDDKAALLDPFDARSMMEFRSRGPRRYNCNLRLGASSCFAQLSDERCNAASE
ncbi:hypothetical protein [Bradyrhizobium sp. ORS 285]|uniref:hypothetical protein n=1 Tax=Bradyrhizobium sp. ORS 285 TaxID=115808 RepID=UPI0002D54C3C|nr:hypothetical protein [Bradyrhizobium sp. ORS 285]